MIQPTYITSILEQNNFDVQYLNGVNTGAISIHNFSVQAEGTEDEVVTVKYSKTMGDKVFIHTENGTSILGEQMTRKLEETIMLAISMTPENLLPNLLNPIFFSSGNFSDLKEYDIDEDTIEQDFFRAVKPISKKANDKKFSFFVLSFPINKYSNLIIKMFERLDSFHSVVQKNNKMFIQFYGFNEMTSKEFKTIHNVKQSLTSIGFITDVVDLLEVS